MAHPNDNRPDPLKPTAVTNKPTEQPLPGTPGTANGGVTGTQPGMPDAPAKRDPNAGPGGERKDRPDVERSGTIIDRSRTPADETVDHERTEHDNAAPSDIQDDRRDQANDREEDVKGHKVGDAPNEHTTRANERAV